jgi:uncharacterized phage protein gp47/JayE
MAGLTLEGFTPLTLAETKERLEASLRAAFGDGIDLSAQSVFGQLVGVYAEQIADLWESAEDTYHAFSPEASGAALDNVAGLAGLVRLAAAPSSITVAFASNEVPGLIGAGLLLQNPAGQWRTASAEESFEFFDWGSGEEYDAGAFVAVPYGVDDRAAVWYCISRVDPSTVEPPGGVYLPGVTTSDDINGGQWVYVGDLDSTSQYSGCTFVDARHAETGPIFSGPGPVTAYSGAQAMSWLAAIPGRNIETDPELRLRREGFIRRSGANSVDSIRSAVLAVPGVSAAVVRENTSDFVDSDGIPAHGLKVVVEGGERSAIVQVVWNNKPAGIALATGGSGSTTGNATDGSGNSQPVTIYRPTTVVAYARVTLRVNDLFPEGGNDLVKSILVSSANALPLGEPIYSSPLVAGIHGLLGVVSCTVELSTVSTSSGLSSTLSLGSTQRAAFSTANVAVVSA